jgi:hypothetical protein
VRRDDAGTAQARTYRTQGEVVSEEVNHMETNKRINRHDSRERRRQDYTRNACVTQQRKAKQEITQ